MKMKPEKRLVLAEKIYYNYIHCFRAGQAGCGKTDHFLQKIRKEWYSKMKLIDEKGRVFGKLNIIDLLALILIAAVAVFVGVKLGGPSESDDGATPGESAMIRYRVQVNSVDPSTYAVLEQYVNAAEGKKDQLLSNATLIDGYVVDCEASPHISYVATDDGQVKAVESSGNDDRLDVIVTIEALVPNSVTNTVVSQEVRAGKVGYTVKTAHIEFLSGTVLSVEWLPVDAFTR